MGRPKKVVNDLDQEVPKKRGPKGPRKLIDWEVFDKLCGFQCTIQEIASWFDMSVDSVERRILENFGMKFAEVAEEKRGKGRVSLRRAQFQAALAGNTALLIWLGKQYLGQTEKIQQQIQSNATTQVELNKESLASYRNVIESLKDGAKAEDKKEVVNPQLSGQLLELEKEK